MRSILGIHGKIQALIVLLTFRPIQVPLPRQRARLFSSDQAAAQRPISLKARSDSLTLGKSACGCQALYFKTTFARMPGSGERVTQKIPTRRGGRCSQSSSTPKKPGVLRQPPRSRVSPTDPKFTGTAPGRILRANLGMRSLVLPEDPRSA